MDAIEFFPEQEKVKYVPSIENIHKVIALADPDTQDYLWLIHETMARVSEVNSLTWDDVNCPAPATSPPEKYLLCPLIYPGWNGAATTSSNPKTSTYLIGLDEQ